LGSDRAMCLLDNVYNEFVDPEYVSQLYDMREYMASVTDSTWAGNLYYNWLYSLMPLLFEKGTGWPVFMTNTAWRDKELSTSLMSWSELRHDTILYAKQSYTVGIPPGAALLNGYVEPNPYAWARLGALAAYTRSGLDGLNLVGPRERERLDMLEALAEDLLNIAVAELLEQPLTPAQDACIAGIGLDLLMIQAVDEPVEVPDSPSSDEDCTAVAADVHTDLIHNECLEEGVGYPWVEFVVVRRGERLLLTRGVHIPYYEFKLPYNERLTDEEWREMLTGSSPPSPPVWANAFRDTAASLVNPTPHHFWYESNKICSFSYSLTPAVLDTGGAVVVDVEWDPFWYGGGSAPLPSLTVFAPDGAVVDVPLELMSGHHYQGDFTTDGWSEGTAVLWFTSEGLGNSLFMDWRTGVAVDPAGSPDQPPYPDEFALSGVFPNPIARDGHVRFNLPGSGLTRLSLWDLSGRCCSLLYDGHLEAGTHLFRWEDDTATLADGVYLLKLSWNGQTRSRPVVVNR
jgi:hypothetical protein